MLAYANSPVACIQFAIFLNDFVEFMSHAYNGLVDMSTAARLLDTDEVAVYFSFIFVYCMQMIL